MFECLSGGLCAILDGLDRRGALREADVVAALREVRVALLEADVALPVVRQSIDSVKEKAIGAEVLRSVTPGQMVIKVVHDELVGMLGEQGEGLNHAAVLPVPHMLETGSAGGRKECVSPGGSS